MKQEKLSEILAKHIVGDVQMNTVYVDGSDPKAYVDRMSRMTETGALFLQRRMYGEAYKCFLKSHVENIDDFWASYYLGSMANENGNSAGANYFFICCLEEAPEDWSVKPMALTNYSSVQFKLGDFAGAESSIDQAVQLNPSLDRPHYMGAIHQIYQKEYDKALKIVNTGLKADPESILLRHLELDLQELMKM